nr:MAG TPA: hypothetical protein [Caudoviricetes sp.]DAX97153.1 MAG TPA: hypothetical protein [Caudoviricetes sp.]
MPHLRAIIFSNRFLSHPNHLYYCTAHTKFRILHDIQLLTFTTASFIVHLFTISF